MIIYFLKFPLEDALGGAELHTLRLAQHFQGQGREIQLLTSDEKLFRLFGRHDLPRKKVFIGWEPTSKWALLLWPLTFLLAHWKLSSVVRRAPLGSVFFCQSLTEKLALTPLALKKGLPVFWLEHKAPGRWLRLNPLLSRYRKLARIITLITVSRFAKKRLVALGLPPANVQIIPPGIKLPDHPLPFPSDFTVGVLSRLDREKGVLEFIKTVQPLLRRRRELRLLIAGRGKEEAAITSWVKKNGLGSQIKLAGYLNDLDRFFLQVSVLVYPTAAEEAFGISLIEAMARGRPVVASRRGAIPEIIAHKQSGFLVDDNRPEDWTRFLLALAERRRCEAMGLAAWHQVQKFSSEKILPKFDALLSLSFKTGK